MVKQIVHFYVHSSGVKASKEHNLKEGILMCISLEINTHVALKIAHAAANLCPVPDSNGKRGAVGDPRLRE